MTEEQFCKNDSAFDGEQVDSIKQIAFRSFNGEELKDYVEHHISLVKESDSLPCVRGRLNHFLSKQQDIPEDVQKIINEKFWDLI